MPVNDSVPHLRIGSGDWVFLGSWVTGTVTGFVTAKEPGVTDIAVVVACAAGVVMAVAMAWRDAELPEV